MDIGIVDSAIRQMVKDDRLADRPSWVQLKTAIISSCSPIPSETVDEWRVHIVQRFMDCKFKQMQQHELQLLDSQMPAAPCRPPTPPNTDLPATLRSTGIADKFEPTLDEKTTAENPCIMSIYLDSKIAWAGAAMKYCLEDDSYISSRIVARHRLHVQDGYTMLTWRPMDSPKTYMTRFTVVEGLSCDFMLGSKSTDMDYNQSASVRSLHISSPLDMYDIPQSQAIPRSPNYIFDNSMPNNEILGELILGVAKAIQREPRQHQQCFSN
ncbi:hypothetical protein BDZ45DRAFT_744246 [Acephala macrosclerotiorum]|nr:hypothetical protein BDZ45DRAFT_744246 [Acephala macrosclerotiorum]